MPPLHLVAELMAGPHRLPLGVAAVRRCLWIPVADWVSIRPLFRLPGRREAIYGPWLVADVVEIARRRCMSVGACSTPHRRTQLPGEWAMACLLSRPTAAGVASLGQLRLHQERVVVCTLQLPVAMGAQPPADRAEEMIM